MNKNYIFHTSSVFFSLNSSSEIEGQDKSFSSDDMEQIATHEFTFTENDQNYDLGAYDADADGDFSDSDLSMVDSDDQLHVPSPDNEQGDDLDDGFYPV